MTPFIQECCLYTLRTELGKIETQKSQKFFTENVEKAAKWGKAKQILFYEVTKGAQL